jgi:acetyl esterase/lipase/lysophospholipase L1-like esterase
MKILPVSLFVLSMFPAHSQVVRPLYDGKIPNSITPSVPIDTTMTYTQMNGAAIEILRGVNRPTLTVFLPPPDKATGVGVIICPGGGYQILATSHEGTDVAKKLNEAGVAGFVLRYRLPNTATMSDKRFGPLMDAQRAVQLVRENARSWNLDPNKIGIMGASAGGHLAATASTHFKDEKIDNPKRTSLRPDFTILNYPVISFQDGLTHGGSRENLIGTAAGLNSNDIDYFSNEQQVSAQTPPAFITAPLTDKAVPVNNSLVYVAALQQQRIPVETFFYPAGEHGYGMNNPTAREQWMDACIRWIKNTFATNMDWANLKRYQKENEAAGRPKAGEQRVVFMGNSITEGWLQADPGFFANKPYLNRGISGQTTSQMVVRFRQDVIDLQPKVVVILAGTNDIAGNTGPMSLEQIMANIQTMAELARANNIRVVLSSVLPAFDYPWRPGLEPSEKIVRLNTLIQAYAKKTGAVYLDYFSAVVDERKGLKKELGYDGVHPNLAGYRVMGPLAERAIEMALKIPGR